MRRTFYALSAFIVISFLTLGGVLNYLAHNHMHQTTEDKIIRDLEILSTITQGAIAHGDYERIEEQVLLWGEKDPNIIAIRLELDGDSPIVKFDRGIQTPDILRHKHTVSSFTGRSVTFEILYNLAEHKRNTLVFAVVFFSLSGCIAVGFILSLWMILQRLAIIPLKLEISERKQAEEGWRLERNRVINILDSMQDGVYIANQEYDIEYVNSVLKEKFGAVEGRRCYEYFHDRKEICPWCKNKEVLAGKSVRWEWYSFKNQRTYDLIDTPLKNPDGSISKLEIFRDITDIKRTEEALREANDIINRSPSVAFLWKNAEGWPVEFVSYNVKELFGYTAEEFTSGKVSYAKTVHPGDLERVAEEVSTYSKEKERKRIFHEPYRIISKSGKTIWLDDRTSIRRDKKGNITHYEGVVINITDRKEMEEELRKYQEHLEQLVRDRTKNVEDAQKALLNLLEDINETKFDLEKANKKLMGLDRLKSMFIASMSHELRTPLNSIIGFTGIILQGLDGDINPRQQDHLQRTYRSAKHLLELIADVIDVSKIEAGKTETFVGEFNLIDVIEEAVSSLKPALERKGLDIEVRLAENLPMKTDRKRLLQCVLNCLSNAVKYTEQGQITVMAKKIEDAVDITVEDTGIGIRESDLPLLFGSFVRLDTPLKLENPGTGLGLYLTNKIVTEMLKGSVSLDSVHGKGSRFSLKVPMEI